MRIERHLDALAGEAIQQALGLDAPALLKPTTDPRHGDYQVNAALPLAKRLKKPPRELAEALAHALSKNAAVARAEVAGPGFVNLTLDDAFVAARLAEDVVDPQDGVPQVETPDKVVVDFSGPNIAKQMHVGHLRSTIIGDAMVRLLRFVGHEVIGDNHLGDWGTQFGLLIVGMREFGDEQALGHRPIVELERIYKQASARAQQDEAFAAQAREELAKLQNGDRDNTALWKEFVEATKVKLDEVYAQLDVRFDAWLGESAYNEMLPGVVQMLKEAGLAREDDGAVCVFFHELEGAPKELAKQKQPLIVQKKDGAYLYSTTDIATLQYRREEWHATRVIYVVDMRQALHFKQLFGVAQLLGWSELRCEHLGFGSVLGTDGKPLKTRDASGRTITLASLLDEAVARAEQRLKEEGVDLPAEDVPRVARAVGIGAVKYADLHQNRASDYQFDFDKMITFKGNSGPYLQYAYARIQSIFRKGQVDPAMLDPAALQLEHQRERELGRVLLRFGDVVHAAADQGLPHLVSDHLYALARAYSGFFESCPVLKAEGPTRESRLLLCALTAHQLRRGLGLLGIETVDRM